MNTRALVAGVALGLLCMTHARADQPVQNFTRLPAGDVLRVRFTSGGCFHFYTYDLVFERGATARVSITAVDLKWSEKQQAYHDGETTKLGELTLTPADLAGLNNLLEFYRKIQPGGCTMTNKIEISQWHSGAVIAKEQFEDSTCSSYRAEKILTFDSLARRLRETR